MAAALGSSAAMAASGAAAAASKTAAAAHVGSGGVASQKKPPMGKAASMLVMGGDAQTDTLMENGLVARPAKPGSKKASSTVNVKAIWQKFYDAAHILSVFKFPEPCYDYGVVHRFADQFIKVAESADVISAASHESDVTVLSLSASASKQHAPSYVGLPLEISAKINQIVALLQPKRSNLQYDNDGELISQDLFYPAENHCLWRGFALNLMEALDKIKP